MCWAHLAPPLASGRMPEPIYYACRNLDLPDCNLAAHTPSRLQPSKDFRDPNRPRIFFFSGDPKTVGFRMAKRVISTKTPPKNLTCWAGVFGKATPSTGHQYELRIHVRLTTPTCLETADSVCSVSAGCLRTMLRGDLLTILETRAMTCRRVF